MRSLESLILCGALLVVSCGGGTPPAASPPAEAESGATSPEPEDAASPEQAPPPEAESAQCGSNVCGEGEYCCNASCGICAPVGGMCTQQFCE